MSECKHNKLLLLKADQKKMRCTICHLTISSDELGQNYCPECFEINKNKHYDFEAVESKNANITKYRCEGCGLMIEC